ncbi:MAG: exodeoxyribonuclease VII small subunit [Oceanococcus sp.]
MPAKNDKLDQFENKLSELETLVRELESGDAPLELAVSHFERGMALSKSCEKLLQQAEMKVQKLLKSSAATDSDQATEDSA